jgi:hypothetical protein
MRFRLRVPFVRAMRLSAPRRRYSEKGFPSAGAKYVSVFQRSILALKNFRAVQERGATESILWYKAGQTLLRYLRKPANFEAITPMPLFSYAPKHYLTPRSTHYLVGLFILNAPVLKDWGVVAK